MSDPDRTAASAHPAPSTADPASGAPARPDGTRPMVWALIWALFAVFLGLNAAGSFIGMPLVVDSLFGAAALGCLVLLGVHYWKGRT